MSVRSRITHSFSEHPSYLLVFLRWCCCAILKDPWHVVLEIAMNVVSSVWCRVLKGKTPSQYSPSTMEMYPSLVKYIGHLPSRNYLLNTVFKPWLLFVCSQFLYSMTKSYFLECLLEERFFTLEPSSVHPTLSLVTPILKGPDSILLGSDNR